MAWRELCNVEVKLLHNLFSSCVWTALFSIEEGCYRRPCSDGGELHWDGKQTKMFKVIKNRENKIFYVSTIFCTMLKCVSHLNLAL